MLRNLHRLALAWFFCFYGTVAAEQWVPMGAGKILVGAKQGHETPKDADYRTAEMKRRALPTNSWFSSLTYMQWSGVLHAHPLSFKATEAGLEVGIPEKAVEPIEAIKAWAWPPPPGRPKASVVHRHVAALTVRPRDFQPQDARLSAKGDWSISVDMTGSGGNQRLRTHIGHGIPYGFFEISDGAIVLEVEDGGAWSADGAQLVDDKLVIYAEARGTPYAVYLPRGAMIDQLDKRRVEVTLPPDTTFFSVAALPTPMLTPDGSQPSLGGDARSLMARHAFAFVTDTIVDWDYSESASEVRTGYSFRVANMDGRSEKPLVGLYPHHWMQVVPGTVLSRYELPSVRGPIRLAATDRFETVLPFGGLLPVWPVTGSEAELSDLSEFLVGDTRRTASLYTGHGNGTYWTGKALGSIAQLILVSEQLGQEERAKQLEGMLKGRMEKWFRGEGGFYFGFHENVGSLVGYPEEYFSASGMNDHHFHYGYWLMAAAHIAKRDPDWLTPERWGKMIGLIARDIATSDRGRDDFPFIRNFDPYEGHSWARGNSDFYGHGNDQESSSEAINAGAALAFLGEFTGDKRMRDLGVYLYVTEIASVLNYWFDIHGIVFDSAYPKPIASMVFGGGYGYSTWWTEEPRQIHGINLLPVTSASVYLAQIPPERALSDIAFMKARRAEYETAAQTDGTPSVIWENVFVSWLALNDPNLALDTWNPDADGSMELGDTRSRTLAWALTLKHFGTPDLSVTADTLMYGVFRAENGRATYCAYNATSAGRVVSYSDGKTLTAIPNTLTCTAD